MMVSWYGKVALSEDIEGAIQIHRNIRIYNDWYHFIIFLIESMSINIECTYIMLFHSISTI